MNKKFLKRIAAFAMAATLVIGNGAIALAAGETSGTADGQGSNEGHVKRHVVSVELPTSVGDKLNYTMDPERLVPETNGANYTGKTFSDDAKSYGVYFVSGTSAYNNKSEVQTVTNKSSAAIDLTVKAEFVSQASTDITIVGEEPAAADFATSGGYKDAKLFMQFSITTGSAATTKILNKEAAVEATISIGGNEDNFALFTTSGSEKYEYRQKADSDLGEWEKANIQLEGKCTYAEAGDDNGKLTAPDVQLTWSWKDPTAGPQVSVSADGKITMSGMTSDKLWAGLSVSFVKNGNAEMYDLSQDNRIRYDNTNYDAATGGTSIAIMNSAWLEYVDGLDVTAKLTLSDGTVVSGHGVVSAN